MTGDVAAPPATRALVAHDVGLRIDGAELLRGVHLTVPVGTLCAVIGPSGSGKSTLLRLLAGVGDPTTGSVAYDGSPVWARAEDVGFVPFGDLVHPQLTVREALDAAAALRLPDDDPTEREERVEDIIGQLHMVDRADAVVSSLSDGERRRVSCGSELVGRPEVLVLDEPTTGLDPGLERRTMLLLRELARDGLAVVVSTHATSSLELCDAIAVVGPGGTIRFVGTHDEVLAHFGASTLDEVYTLVEDAGEDETAPWRSPQADDPAPDVAAPAGNRYLRRLPPFGSQVAILTSRYATCTRRERRSMALQVGQAPIIGVAIGLTVPTSILSDQTLGPYYGVIVGFAVIIASVFMGVVAGCREVVRERDVVRREATIGVRLDAYVVSKCAVLFPIAVVQTFLLVAGLAVLQTPENGIGAYLGVLVVALCANWAAIALGLWISALVRSPAQATGAVPLVLIPQILLSGALIPTARMPAPVSAIAEITITRWGFGGAGSALGLGDTVASTLGNVTGLDGSFFGPGVAFSLVPILAIGAVALVATAVTVGRGVDAEA